MRVRGRRPRFLPSRTQREARRAKRGRVPLRRLVTPTRLVVDYRRLNRVFQGELGFRALPIGYPHAIRNGGNVEPIPNLDIGDVFRRGRWVGGHFWDFLDGVAFTPSDSESETHVASSGGECGGVLRTRSLRSMAP